jgi:serine phosphatase RsbU (regulator of sigma subunit)
MRLLPMRRRLLLLGLLGVLMTLVVAGAALVSLRDVGAINRELALVTRALYFHQDADMMHDALRADVARAHLAGHGHPGYDASAIRRATKRHADRFRGDVAAIEALRLPPELDVAMDRLRPHQQTYLDTAEDMVATALAGGDDVVVAQASYEAAFRQLVPSLTAATQDLMTTSERVKRAAAVERAEAERVITFATLAALAGWVGLVVWHNRSMRSLQGALVREAEQRSAAEVLQRSLLPTHLPEVPGVQLAARSVAGGTGQEVGGDWYDVLTLPTGEVCLVVGDVVGHDLPAAALMGQVRNALRAYALEDPAPTTVLGRVNRAACLLDASDLTTCICVVLDPATMTVEWASAGHLPPAVLSPSGGRLLRGEPGPPLGVEQSAVYRQHQTQLEPGETLLLYTDGLVERRGRPIDAGLSALESVRVDPAEPQAMCDRVMTALADHTVHRDDVTCLLVHVEEGGSVASSDAHSSAVSPTLT